VGTYHMLGGGNMTPRSLVPAAAVDAGSRGGAAEVPSENQHLKRLSGAMLTVSRCRGQTGVPAIGYFNHHFYQAGSVLSSPS
jgi:hypothetical protein